MSQRQYRSFLNQYRKVCGPSSMSDVEPRLQKLIKTLSKVKCFSSLCFNAPLLSSWPTYLLPSPWPGTFSPLCGLSLFQLQKYWIIFQKLFLWQIQTEKIWPSGLTLLHTTNLRWHTNKQHTSTCRLKHIRTHTKYTAHVSTCISEITMSYIPSPCMHCFYNLLYMSSSGT